MLLLKDIIELMDKGGYSRDITIQMYKSKDALYSTIIDIYKGPLSTFAEYIKTHNDIEVDEENGFLHKAIDIERFLIVEICVDHSIRSEIGLPDYNKSKIIKII